MADTVPALLGELAALEDPRAREVNERHGDDLDQRDRAPAGARGS